MATKRTHTPTTKKSKELDARHRDFVGIIRPLWVVSAPQGKHGQLITVRLKSQNRLAEAVLLEEVRDGLWTYTLTG